LGSRLHPILEAYFLSDVLLSNEVNSLLIGEVWAHPNKNKRTTNLPFVSAQNIYNNLGSITQSPRVIITD
jgi:hypothetical protein